ncbi:hypothetical protein [Arthrobacter sp. ov118]|uniref:hypothetical protein n=1 Tax=Arthrobacter sp. ov118 TaxID=1761747 RepID=UPI0008E80D37|nr:hypothetical protein [Arthrobacter sp. ov118]SFT56749.1 hypothetical protein SAMN04487915_101977 [Arthrobacter sp. ov118]
MTRETATSLPVHTAHRHDARVPYGRAKPPTHRNLGLTPSWHVGALAAAAAIALVLGVWSMTQVDPLQIGGAGLIGVLPPAYFVALALSLAGFVASLALRRLVPALLTWQLLVTMVVLNGADPVIHGLPRLEASFRHLGIADNIAQTGQLDPTVDAYFNWPGFFDLLGMLSGATGAKDLMGIATWAPVGINILLLAPLLALARRLTANPRHAWAAVWIFYLASWIGQDYLAPQAYSFVLLLTLVACLLSVFGGWAWPTERSGFSRWLARNVSRLDGAVPRQGVLEPPRTDAAVLVVVCALIVLTMTVSHQLSPFALIPILAALLLTGRLRLRFLPVLAVILPVAWLLFAASTFLQGHFGQLLSSLGDIGANSFGALNTRVSGSDAHMFVVYTRIAEVALVWILAAIGAVVGYRRKTPWLAAAAAAFAPLLLIPLQSYGGELLLRLYLFSLPFAVCLVVLPLTSDKAAGLSLRRSLGLLLMGAVLATGTVVSRYGNDGMESFNDDEIAVVNHLYSTAPAGAILIEAVHNTPWRFQHYADYDYRTLIAAEPLPGAAPISCDSANQIAHRAGAYLIITESQLEAAELRGSTPAGDLQRFTASCATSPGWTKVFENAGGVIFHIEGVSNGN